MEQKSTEHTDVSEPGPTTVTSLLEMSVDKFKEDAKSRDLQTFESIEESLDDEDSDISGDAYIYRKDILDLHAVGLSMQKDLRSRLAQVNPHSAYLDFAHPLDAKNYFDLFGIAMRTLPPVHLKFLLEIPNLTYKAFTSNPIARTLLPGTDSASWQLNFAILQTVSQHMNAYLSVLHGRPIDNPEMLTLHDQWKSLSPAGTTSYAYPGLNNHGIVPGGSLYPPQDTEISLLTEREKGATDEGLVGVNYKVALSAFISGLKNRCREYFGALGYRGITLESVLHLDEHLDEALNKEVRNNDAFGRLLARESIEYDTLFKHNPVLVASVAELIKAEMNKKSVLSGGDYFGIRAVSPGISFTTTSGFVSFLNNYKASVDRVVASHAGMTKQEVLPEDIMNLPSYDPQLQNHDTCKLVIPPNLQFSGYYVVGVRGVLTTLPSEKSDAPQSRSHALPLAKFYLMNDSEGYRDSMIELIWMPSTLYMAVEFIGGFYCPALGAEVYNRFDYKEKKQSAMETLMKVPAFKEEMDFVTLLNPLHPQ